MNALNDADEMLATLTLVGPVSDSDGWDVIESEVTSDTTASALIERDGKRFRVTVEEIQ